MVPISRATPKAAAPFGMNTQHRGFKQTADHLKVGTLIQFSHQVQVQRGQLQVIAFKGLPTRSSSGIGFVRSKRGMLALTVRTADSTPGYLSYIKSPVLQSATLMSGRKTEVSPRTRHLQVNR